MYARILRKIIYIYILVIQIYTYIFVTSERQSLQSDCRKLFSSKEEKKPEGRVTAIDQQNISPLLRTFNSYLRISHISNIISTKVEIGSNRGTWEKISDQFYQCRLSVYRLINSNNIA